MSGCIAHLACRNGVHQLCAPTPLPVMALAAQPCSSPFCPYSIQDVHVDIGLYSMLAHLIVEMLGDPIQYIYGMLYNIYIVYYTILMI